jgi:hypothetical protein
VQGCTTAGQVQYCLYPGFDRDLPSLEAPVSGVLAHLPARPDRPLTIRQVVSVDFTQPAVTDPTLTHGHSQRQVAQWNAQLRREEPVLNAAALAIYLPVGSWPAAGAQLADAHFAMALGAADWAVHLPPATGGLYSRVFQPCVPLNQARQAIAIWLAILATHPPAGELQAGLHSPGFSTGGQATWVRNTFVPIWGYPGAQYLVSSGPPTTDAGYLLAHAMTSLPEQKVAHVLKDAWGRWLNWRTTDAQLAAALGIPVPGLPAAPKPLHPRREASIAPPPSSQQDPLCTT